MVPLYWIIGVGIAVSIIGVVLICLGHGDRHEEDTVYRPGHPMFKSWDAEAKRADDRNRRMEVVGIIACVAGVLSAVFAGIQVFIALASDVPTPVVTILEAEKPGMLEVTIDDQGCWWGETYYQINEGEPTRYEEPVLIFPQDKLTARTKRLIWESDPAKVEPRESAITLHATITANGYGDLTIQQDDLPGKTQKISKTKLAELANGEFEPGSDIEIMNAKGLLRLTISAYDLDSLFEAEGADELAVAVVMENPDDPNGVVEVSLTAGEQEVKTPLKDMVLYLHHQESDPSIVVAEWIRESGFQPDVAGVIPGCAADAEQIAIPLTGAAKVRVVSGSVGFTDVQDSSDQAVAAVNFVDSHGIFQGDGTKVFRPTDNLNRAEAVTVLYNLEGSPRTQSVEGLYQDVPGNAWYEKAVCWAAEKGIIGGAGSNRFNPGKDATRVQCAVMIWRSMDRPETTNKDRPYVDLDAKWRESNDDAILALCWAAENGIMIGKDSTHMAPNDPLTREEAAVMVSRLCAWKAGLTVD